MVIWREAGVTVVLLNFPILLSEIKLLNYVLQKKNVCSSVFMKLFCCNNVENAIPCAI